VEFRPARCPNCSGSLQLPETVQRVKCLYCGQDIVVRDAIKLAAPIVNTGNLLELAKNAISASNFIEANQYYNL